MGFLPGETTRQWSFTVSFLHVGGSYNLFYSFQGFEWAIRDVSKLRDFVEGVVHEDGSQALVSEAGEFEILKQSPILGDHKFKLEIGV